MKMNAVVLAMLLSIVLALNHMQIAEAYNEETHNQIVLDAFEYILSMTQPVIYADGSTNKTDRELVIKVLAAGAVDEDNAIALVRSVADILGESSIQTDFKEDVILNYCAPYLPRPCFTDAGSETLGIYFTLFSHFLNIHAGNDLIWPRRGYYFGYVRENKVCQATGADRLVNYFIGREGTTVERDKSDAYRAFRDPRQTGVTDGTLLSHFNQDIAYIHFWPITNLAQYWYQKFKDSSIPEFALPELGAVLHAAADTTVPFHAVGLSGCGHTEYEANVEKAYQHPEIKVFKRDVVRDYLVNEPWLSKERSIDEILVGNARHSAAKCVKDVNSSHCPFVTEISDVQKATKELVNLAIAATVVIIRKALSESRGDSKIPTMAVAKKQPETDVYNSWADVVVLPLEVRASNDRTARELQSQIDQSSQSMKTLIVNMQQGKLTKAKFQEDFLNAADAGSAPLVANPAAELLVPGITRESQRPPRFRGPTTEEITDQAKWTAYLEMSRAFYDAEVIQRLGQTLTILNTTSTPNASETERSEVDGTIKRLRQAITEIVDRTPQMQ